LLKLLPRSLVSLQLLLMQLIKSFFASMQVSFISWWRIGISLLWASILLQLLNGFSILLDCRYCLRSQLVLSMLIESIMCCFVLSLRHHLYNLLWQEVNLRMPLYFLEFFFLGCNWKLLRINALVFHISILIFQKLLKISRFGLFVFGGITLRSKSAILYVFMMLFKLLLLYLFFLLFHKLLFTS